MVDAVGVALVLNDHSDVSTERFVAQLKDGVVFFRNNPGGTAFAFFWVVTFFGILVGRMFFRQS